MGHLIKITMLNDTCLFFGVSQCLFVRENIGNYECAFLSFRPEFAKRRK